MDDVDEPTQDDRSWTAHTIRDGEPIPQAVVRAVSTETETDSLELPPLYSVLDPDALDALLAAPSGSSSRPDCTVTFGYYGREVQVTSAGTIQISPAG